MGEQAGEQLEECAGRPVADRAHDAEFWDWRIASNHNDVVVGDE